MGYEPELSLLLRKDEGKWLEPHPNTIEFWEEAVSHLSSLSAFQQHLTVDDLKIQLLFLSWKLRRITLNAEVELKPPRSKRSFTAAENALLMGLIIQVIPPGPKIPEFDEGSIAPMFGKIELSVILGRLNSSPLFGDKKLSLNELDTALDALHGAIEDLNRSPLCDQGERLEPPVNTASDNLSGVLQVRTSYSSDFPTRPTLIEM